MYIDLEIRQKKREELEEKNEPEREKELEEKNEPEIEKELEEENKFNI